MLADEGYKVTGADISPKLIYHARAKAQERDIQFLVCDAGCPLPFIDHTFDAVVLFQSVLEYLDNPTERQTWAREMHRIIRPSGVLIVDIVAESPATDTFEDDYWIKRINDRDRLFYDCLTESKCVKHLYTEDELRGLLSGFVLQFLRTNTKCQLVEQGPKRVVIGRRCLE